MSALAPERRRFMALAAATAWLAPRQAFADEAGEPVIAYWGESILIRGVVPGDWLLATVDGDPLYIRRRTPAQIAAARATPLSVLLDPERDEARAPDGEWLVVSGQCTHAGCQAQAGLGPYGGWQCFCHGSIYDLSGRVRQGPARRNLSVIPHVIENGAVVLKRP